MDKEFSALNAGAKLFEIIEQTTLWHKQLT